MARVVKNDKGLKVISMSISEARAIGLGFDYFGKRVVICDRCSKYINNNVYYVATLNQCLCTSCYFEWYEHAKKYNDDESYETKKFKETLNALKANNILVTDKHLVESSQILRLLFLLLEFLLIIIIIGVVLFESTR